MPSPYIIIGLMSGTSLDGIDAALIETDGERHVKRIDFMSRPYDDALRDKLRRCLGQQDATQDYIQDAARDMTLAHSALVKELCAAHPDLQIDAIGFHGQTIYHAPNDGVTIQIGDAALLAEDTGIDVVYDFRSADVAAGGEGAPLLPLYHRAIALNEHLELPVTFLNIGGVSNITQIDGADDAAIYACDTGPGNALIDDAMQRLFNKKYDTDGITSKNGVIHTDILDKWMAHPYFKRSAPKSLDRDAWAAEDAYSLAPHDSIATLAAFTIESISHHITSTNAVYVCGGGRHNTFFMDGLSAKLSCPVKPIEALGYNGDSIEAEGFAYLAARILNGQPVSLPTTTGTAPNTLSGSIYKRAQDRHHAI
ncbi:MAG: anhydro-N-acetylmuramic acid kinase [Pseudomonadota bacterium]|nr:anhydro-N-acetylmuramic acid kinase [Pseudomonadota bacterium]MEE3322587.1 anhydro-N-acetylmuramic acid kinase [Pseudomonadota bacterium]